MTYRLGTILREMGFTFLKTEAGAYHFIRPGKAVVWSKHVHHEATDDTQKESYLSAWNHVVRNAHWYLDAITRALPPISIETIDGGFRVTAGSRRAESRHVSIALGVLWHETMWPTEKAPPMKTEEE